MLNEHTFRTSDRIALVIMTMPLQSFMRDLLSQNSSPGFSCPLDVALIVDNAARPTSRSSSCSHSRKGVFQREKLRCSKRSRGGSRWDQGSLKVTQTTGQAPPVAPERMMSPDMSNGGRKSLNKGGVGVCQPQRKPSIESPLKHNDSFYRNRQRLSHVMPPSVMLMSHEQLNSAFEQALYVCDTSPAKYI